MAFKYQPTQESVKLFWTNEMLRNKNVYLDTVNEICCTTMAEDAMSHFKVETPNGDSDIESNIFDWAVDYSNEIETYPNLNKFLSSQINR